MIIFHASISHLPFVNAILTLIVSYCVAAGKLVDRQIDRDCLRDTCVCVRARPCMNKYVDPRLCARSYVTRMRIHVHGPHIFGSRALKLSLYFIGRAYKSKASASQILEALYTANVRGCVMYKTPDTCLSIGIFLICPLARIIRVHHTCISTVYRDETKSRLLALRIIISQMAYL